MKNLLRRTGALAAAVMMCFALTVPALADSDLSGNVTVYRRYTYTSDRVSFVYSGSNSSSALPLTSQTYLCDAAYSTSNTGWSSILYGSTVSSGSVAMYLSYYYYDSVNAFTQSRVPTVDDFSVAYLETGAKYYTYSPVSSVVLFAPSSSATSVSDGVRISGRFSVTPGVSVTSSALCNTSVSAAGTLAPTALTGLSHYVSPVTSWSTGSSSHRPYFAVSSYRIVSADSDATLDGLENIADSITAQNSMLSAYYGDIVAVCNQIYQRLGDMQQTQQEANALLSSLVSLLNSTNGKISALNQAMSTYFELVLKSLENESLSIQDCIDDAEARLEAYLKPMIDYFTELEEQTGESASTLPQHKTDIDGFDNQGYGIDGDGQAGLAALVPIFGSFSWIFSVIAIFVGVGIINLLVKKGLS